MNAPQLVKRFRNTAPPQEEAASGLLAPFRVQFSTDVVKPTALPDFPYVTSKLTFDAVVYTAIVLGEDLADVTEQIRSYWPKAEPHEAQRGVRAFRPSDMHLPSVQFGAVEVTPKKNLWSRLFGSKE